MTDRQQLFALFVEDSADDAELIGAELRRGGYDVHWVRCDSYEGLSWELDAALDVVLCDYSLPGMDPIEILRRIRATVPDLPVIVLSGAVREDVAATLFRHGATDLLSKDRLARLVPAVRAATSQRELRRIAVEATERERLTYSLLLGLLRHAPAAICVRDGGGRPLVSNRLYEDLAADGMLGSAAPSSATIDRDLHAALVDAPPGELPDPRREEIQVHGSTFLGLSFPIAVSGRRLAMGEILMDITRQKLIEQELLRARGELQEQARRLQVRNAALVEADRLKTELVATVSHELRTPLTSILGYSELLTDAGLAELGPVPGRMVEMISRNSARLLTLIDNLLLLAKLDGLGPAGEPAGRGCSAAADVGELLDAVASMILPTAHAAGLDLVIDAVPGLVVACQDRDQLERALINLASNAVKFSRPGGVVTLRSCGAGGQVVIEVVDQGIGMAEDELAQIGTRFFRGETARENQVPGTGLGVSVVRAIVESHGGSLGYESRPGAGTTARLLLPPAR